MTTLDPRFVSEHWPLSGVSIGETYQSYPTRRVLRVDAREGAFVAKVDLQPPALEDALRASAVYSYLAERGYPHAPRLLPARDGAPVIHSECQSVMLMEYVAGGHPAPTSETWRGLGLAAARLNAMQDCPYPYGVPTEGVIRELAAAGAGHVDSAEFRRYVDLLYPLLDAQPLGLIHGEINLGNAMRRQTGALVLIDWDEAGTGATVLEAGYPLLTVFLTEDLQLRRDLAAAFYGAYYGAGQPDDKGQDLLFRAALLHALRYQAWGNRHKRWERIRYAVAHQAELLDALFGRPAGGDVPPES